MKWQLIIILMIIAIGGISMISQVSATDIGWCAVLSSANTVYTLNASVSADTTCMNVTATNVTLDCNGFTVNFSNSAGGYGVYSNQATTTVKNCKINQTVTRSGAVGVYMTGGSGNISNNTINMRGDTGDDTVYAISIQTGAYYNVHYNNVTTGTSNYCRGIEIGGSNNLTNNKMTMSYAYDRAFYLNGQNNVVINTTLIFAGSGANKNGFMMGTNNNVTGVYIEDIEGGSVSYFYLGWNSNSYIKEVYINAGVGSSSTLFTSYGAGWNYFINVTTVNVADGGFNFGGLGIKRYWYADTYVNDTSGNPLNATNVSIYNVNGDLINTQLTNTSGYTPSRQTLMEYMQNQTARYDETNYSFNATLTGYTNNAVAVNLTGNRIAGTNPVVITLTASGGGDTTAPTFTTIPANASLWFGNQTLGVEFDATDETAFGGFYINDSKFSINSTGWLSNVSLMGTGVYTINVTINDTSNNKNWTLYRVTINKDNYLCDVLFNETSPQIYPKTFRAYTNCNSGFVLYRNGTAIANNTEQNVGTGFWNFSVTRNDTTNYTYVYDTEYFTIQANTGICDVVFNTTSPKTYPSVFLAYTNCNSAFTLRRNNTAVTNNTAQALASNTWNFSVQRTDTINYSFNYDDDNFIIDPASSSISLIINGTSNNKTSTYPNSTYVVNATVNISGLTVTLYRNNTLINQGTTSVQNTTSYPAISYYNFKGNTTGNENYSSSQSPEYSITVNKNTSSCGVFFNTTSPQVYPDKFIVYTNCTSAYTLYRNGTAITNNTEQDVGTGYWNFSVVRTDGTNYTNIYNTEFFTITQATINVDLYLNGNLNQDVPLTYPTESNATGYASVGTLGLYKNGVAISNPEILTQGIGIYTYKVNATGNTNYSNNATGRSYNLTVLINSGVCDVLFNTTTPKVYPARLKAYTNCNSAFTLYRNGTSITNNSEQDIGNGYWNFSVARTDTENYTNSYDTEFFTITKNTGVCDVLFNTTSPLVYPSLFRGYSNCNSAFTLYRNGTSTINNSAQDIGVGYWNYSVSRTDKSNYTNLYDTEYFTITKATTALALGVSPTWTEESGTETTVTGSGCIATCGLFIDGVATDNPDTQTLAVGIYNYTYNTSGNTNYTADSESNNLTILYVDLENPVAEMGTNPVDTFNSTTTSVSFELKCTDNIVVNSLQLWTNKTGTWSATATNSSALNNTIWNKTVSGFSNDDYIWGVYCNDLHGNEDWSASNRTFTVSYTAPPSGNVTGGGQDCKYKQFGYYNPNLVWFREANCIK